MSSKAVRPLNRGFTFIELVVVISIIVALAAIGFPVWGMISTRVKVNATDALVNSVATQITNYQQKTWQWNIGTAAAPNMRMYHTFDLNHFDPGSGTASPDLEDGPNGTKRFYSIDGYMPPLAQYAGGSHEEQYVFATGSQTFTSAPQSADPEKKVDPKPWDVNFPIQVLNSGYRGFLEMTGGTSIKKTFINKRGQVVDAWNRPLRIAFAAKVYGTQAFGVWSAGLDKIDNLEGSPVRPSKDDLRSWKTQGAE